MKWTPVIAKWSGLHTRRFTAAQVRDTSNGGKETLALLGEGRKPATDCRVLAGFLSSVATAAEAPKLTSGDFVKIRSRTVIE